MTDIRIPRETAEFIPVPVYQGDELVTSFDVAVTLWPARPTVWLQATVVEGTAGVAVAGLARGTYQVWTRVGGTVIEAGTIEVT